jgi:hypothetical protein
MRPYNRKDEEELGSNPALLLSWPGGIQPDIEKYRQTKIEDQAIDLQRESVREWQRVHRAKLHRHMSEPGHNTTQPWGCWCDNEQSEVKLLSREEALAIVKARRDEDR